MKKNAFKFMPAVAFLFAIGAALVTEASDRSVAGTLKGKRVSDNQWVTITGEYSCVSSSRDCTAEFNAQGTMIPGTLRAGTYTPAP